MDLRRPRVRCNALHMVVPLVRVRLCRRRMTGAYLVSYVVCAVLVMVVLLNVLLCKYLVRLLHLLDAE